VSNVFTRFLRSLGFWRRGARHPAGFVGYVRYAVDGIRRMGLSAPDGRDSVWLLKTGTRIRSFGEDDWKFTVPGVRGEVLGLCYWGNPVRVLLGSDGQGRYNVHTARHEAGHVTRMQAGDFGHNPVFRPLFQGWSDDGRRVVAAGDAEPSAAAGAAAATGPGGGATGPAAGAAAGTEPGAAAATEPGAAAATEPGAVAVVDFVDGHGEVVEMTPQLWASICDGCTEVGFA
jgi:hypothetical protein